jgi:hypothetical protein
VEGYRSTISDDLKENFNIRKALDTCAITGLDEENILEILRPGEGK